MPRNDDPQRALGRAIRARRETLGLRQEELALAVGTDQARISRLEKDGENPSYGTAARIARKLGMELWELAKLASELEQEEDKPEQHGGDATSN